MEFFPKTIASLILGYRSPATALIEDMERGWATPDDRTPLSYLNPFGHLTPDKRSLDYNETFDMDMPMGDENSGNYDSLGYSSEDFGDFNLDDYNPFGE